MRNGAGTVCTHFGEAALSRAVIMPAAERCGCLCGFVVALRGTEPNATSRGIVVISDQ